MSSFEMQSIGSPKYCLPVEEKKMISIRNTKTKQRVLTGDHQAKCHENDEGGSVVEAKCMIVDDDAGLLEKAL